MTDSTLPNQKKKVTLKASSQGIFTAENALIRLGFGSKSHFAASNLLSRSTVTKFFQGEPIQLDSLKRICTALELGWQSIVGMSQVTEQKISSEIELKISAETEDMGKMPTLRRQVTVVDPNSEKVKIVITLDGDVDSVNSWEIIQLLLRQNSGSSINIIDIESGSIHLTVEGSQEDIHQLIDKIRSRELTELNILPVESIEISNQNSNTQKIDKWDLVKDIVARRITGRSLSNADLSGANLSDTDLSGANLSGAILSGADLSGAILSYANLSGAILSYADLSDTYLRGTNLNDAYLSGANLSGADVKNTRFGDNQGISESMKIDLRRRGAIFAGSPGDRSETYAIR
jgi:DNA-binding Xre family transcriptional regulator